MNLRNQLLKLASNYCLAVGLSKSRVSTQIFNDGKRLSLIEGGSDLTTKSFEKAVLWFSARWPENAEWPEGIRRPDARDAA